MKRLVLLRHAKAVPHGAIRDFDRGLEPRGRVEAGRSARLLADLGLAPDVAVVSPARRTQETWAQVSPILHAGAVEEDKTVYEADARALLSCAQRRAEADTVLIVGHNPGLKDAARLLMGEGPHNVYAAANLARGLPTSCALVLAFDGAVEVRSARLAAFIAPEREDDDAA
jgi:phosphohistidine phosphatase